MQVLQSAPGELGSGAANRSVNPELICPPYILWPRRVHAGSDPSSRDRSRHRPPCDPSSRDLSRRRAIFAVIAQAPPVVARPRTCRRALHTRHRPFFLNSRIRRRALRTRRRQLLTRCREVCDPSLRPFPRPPRTRPRAPYKYARVLIFPRTLSEHPGLHLLPRLLVGFSKGYFTFFIARHPP